MLEHGGTAMSERKPEPTGEFLDPKSFGQLVDIHRESVYRAIARGDLQAIRVGRSIRLPRAQLDALVIGDNRDADNQAEQDER